MTPAMIHSLEKGIRGLSKDTKRLSTLCIICMLIFIGIQSIMLFNLKKDITQAFTNMETVLDDYTIHTEPEVMESDFPNKKMGKFTLSWYSPKELGKQYPQQLRTSKGNIPKKNHTIAVDPKVIPYGSLVYIQNYGYFIAEDCGGHIKGNRIDIFTDSHKEAIENGRKVANVWILGSL